MYTLTGLTSSLRVGKGKNQINCVPAIRDGNGNYQKSIPLFGTGTGNLKKIPAVWQREFKAFPLGNIREREFPLMPGVGSLIADPPPAPNCLIIA